MSDHADTIRRALDYGPTLPKRQEARAALDALLAERQQAQDERDRFEKEYIYWRDRAHNAEREQRDELRQRQQAIEALREAARRIRGGSGEVHGAAYAVITAALSKLDEQPK